MPVNANAAESCAGLEQRLRQHPKLRPVGEPAAQAFIELAVRVCALDPERVTVDTGLKGFIPFGLRDAPARGKNFTDTYMFRPDAIVLALKTGELRGRTFQDGAGLSRALRTREGRFESYDRQVTLSTPKDVPDIFELVRQCYEAFRQARERKSRAQHQSSEARVDFSVVHEARLQAQLCRDWEEARRVFNIDAWKSCIVLCRGIVEGMLINVLERDEGQAQRLYRGREKSTVANWDLRDVVDVAGRMKVLDPATAKRCDALRDDGNLIHPVRHVRQEISITQEQGTQALATVALCHRKLLERAGLSH